MLSEEITVKIIMILLTAVALTAPFAAHADDKTAQAKDTTAITGNRITQGPKDGYEVAALFNILEKKGLITREELAKEVKRLDLKPFTDSDPYISIR